MEGDKTYDEKMLVPIVGLQECGVTSVFPFLEPIQSWVASKSFLTHFNFKCTVYVLVKSSLITQRRTLWQNNRMFQLFSIFITFHGSCL